jgi:PEP-CTERM motif
MWHRYLGFSIVVGVWLTAMPAAAGTIYSFEGVVTQSTGAGALDPLLLNVRAGDAFSGTFFYGFDAAPPAPSGYSVGSFADMQLGYTLNVGGVQARSTMPLASNLWMYTNPGLPSSLFVQHSGNVATNLSHASSEMFLRFTFLQSLLTTGVLPLSLDASQFGSGAFVAHLSPRNEHQLIGSITSFQAVPEPATIGLLALGSFAALKLRRRRPR